MRGTRAVPVIDAAELISWVPQLEAGPTLAVAGAASAAGLGVSIVFGGEIHAATGVRKVDSTGPAAFGSPLTGPLGRVVEGRVWLHARPLRPATLTIAALSHRVELVTATLG